MVQWRLLRRPTNWHLQRKKYNNNVHSQTYKYIKFKVYLPRKHHTFINIGDYRRVLRTDCNSQDMFDSLETAKVACSSDSDCIGIQDASCDSRKYHLCHNIRIYKQYCPYGGCDCGYIKENYHGRFLFYNFSIA